MQQGWLLLRDFKRATHVSATINSFMNIHLCAQRRGNQLQGLPRPPRRGLEGPGERGCAGYEGVYNAVRLNETSRKTIILGHPETSTWATEEAALCQGLVSFQQQVGGLEAPRCVPNETCQENKRLHRRDL